MLTTSAKTSSRFSNLLFFVIFSVTFLIRLFVLTDQNTAFTSDQARDMLAIRSIVINLDPPLLGPITGIPGLYLGPFWFFFNTVPFALTGGDPISLVVWQIIWFQFSALLLYLYFKSKNQNFALLASSLYLLSPIYFYTARYSFNPHLLPAFTVFFLLLSHSFFNNPKGFKAFFLGVLLGLCLQLEAATAIAYLPALLFTWPKKQRLFLTYLFIGLLITLVPQLLFELRHDFLMTKVVIDQFTGKNDVVMTSLSVKELLLDRFNSLKYLFNQSLPVFAIITFPLTILGIFNFIKNQKSNTFLKLSLLIVFFFYLTFLIYPHPIKTWYLYPFSLIIIIFISHLLRKFTSFSYLIIILFGLYAFSVQYRFHLSNLNTPSLDPSNLNNRLKTVDEVYQLSQNNGFVVYNYLPSVYDYPYQYLFWWQGYSYGYHPNQIAYQPNVPEYIPNSDSYLTLKKPGNQVFLIIEDGEPEKIKSWLESLNFCSNKTIDLPWNTTIMQGDICLLGLN